MEKTRNRHETDTKQNTKRNARFVVLFFGIIFALTFFLAVNLNYCQGDSTVDISTTATVREFGEEPEPPPSGGGSGGTIIVSPGKVILKGRAYPNAFLTILKNGKVAATFFAEKSGLFEKELTGLSGGVCTFGIFAEDSDARKSVTLSFTVSVLAKMTTTISGIFISPTIALTPTHVEKGNIVDILGQAFPESQVNIFISSKETVKTTGASENGKWSYKLNTGFLEEAEHKARAKALFGEGEQSPFSQTLSFLVVSPGALVCQGADLNFDGSVNIIDFSILLYFWEQARPSNKCADINFDGNVSIIDFSIMMYQWTG
ncbi:hypothetical protein KAS79_03875 [Candidatus Parcubacteria bacterium]|nr:hypothetical protein [Candidatus Parcubacteria bacterium]